jgi:hypothetical protein
LPINGAVVSAIQPVASFWPTERKRGLIMKTSQGFKVLTAVGLFVSLSASLSVATIAFAGKASAATPLSAVTCSHLKGSIITDTATLSGCSGTTGGSGSVSSFVPTGGDVTWSNGTTTDYTSTYANSGTKCPSTAFEVNIKGTVLFEHEHIHPRRRSRQDEGVRLRELRQVKERNRHCRQVLIAVWSSEHTGPVGFESGRRAEMPGLRHDGRVGVSKRVKRASG